MIAEQFIASIGANLAYWQRQAGRLDDNAIASLDKERHNLFRAIQFGLTPEATRKRAIELILPLFHLVERRGYWLEWLAILQRALQSCPDAPSATKFELLYQLGHLHRLTHNFSEALNVHRQAEAVAQALGDDRFLAQARFAISADLQHSRQYEAAEEYGLMALETFTSLGGEMKWPAATLNTLGLIARETNRPDVARQRFAQAAALWRRAEDPTELARALNNLAIAWQESQEFETALACYREAADILETTTSNLDKIMVQISLGSLYYRMDKLDEAEAVFRQIDLAFLQRIGHTRYQAATTNNLGNVLLKKKRLLEAELYLRRSLALWPELAAELSQANTTGSLAETLAGQGRHEEALSHYDTAINILEKYPDHPWAQKLLQEFTDKRDALLRQMTDEGRPNSDRPLRSH